MIDDLLGNIELIVMSFLVLALLIFFGLLIIVIFLFARERRHFRPVIRTESKPEELMKAVEHVSCNLEAYVKNIQFLQESRSQSPDAMSKKYIGLVLLKNVGNSPAIDLETRRFSSYIVSDGPEAKLFSLNQGESKLLLFYLPPDCVNSLQLNKISVKYKNCLNETFRDRFLITHNTGIGTKLEDQTTILAMVQI
jgi:hypothetical protein